MNILIPDSWLREYLETDATPRDIQRCLSLCGPSVERIYENKLTTKNKDWIYDIEITTNRVDCMSVIGIAREAAAILPLFGIAAHLKFDPYSVKSSLETSSSIPYIKAKVDTKLCSRFSAVLIRNVTVKTSPENITRKLESVGMRGLNNLVDITNLVMHEMGQPVHVFDYDKINKHLMILRKSRKGETIVTLDGKKHTLPGGDIVIEDGAGSLIDLCGIMGGKNSSVSESTTKALLFVQTYSPNYIRKTSMALAHRTQAATLFEKQLPEEIVPFAMKKALDLVLLLAGGQPESPVLDIGVVSDDPKVINMDTPVSSFTSNRLGVDVTPEQSQKILSSLGFTTKTQTKIEVPFYRKYDINIPEDLVEEIARLYGYHNLPSTLMPGSLPEPISNPVFDYETHIKTALKYFGFNEIYTYSLVTSGSGLKLKNPLSSDWAYLRTALFPSHKEVIRQNAGKTDFLKFFEIANVYLPQDNQLPKEEGRLILSTTGIDYDHFKGFIEGLLKDLNVIDFPVNIHSENEILFWEEPLASVINQINPRKTFIPISKYSPIIEDVNMSLTRPYTEIINDIRLISPLVQSIELIDKYEGKITLRLTFLDSRRQLSSSDLEEIRSRIESIK